MARQRGGVFLKMTTMILAASAASAQTTGTAKPQEPTTVDVSRGGVTIASGPNSLTLGARVQFRWTLDSRDEGDADTIGSGAGREDGVFSQFDVPRLRVTLGGGAYRPWLKYLFQFDFSRTSGAGDSKIKDAIIEIRPTGRSYAFQAGQFKAPFGLQQLISSGRQQFVDRAITDGKFNPGRDMGVMATGTAAGRVVGWQGGVFNGAGESVTQNTGSHLLVGRVFVNPWGVYPLAESATDGPRTLLHVGAAARTGKAIRGRSAAGAIEDADNQTALAAEFAWRSGRLSSTAEYFWMHEEQQNPVPGPDLDARGFHAQAGYMLAPRTAEVALRFARVDPDTDRGDDGVSELRAVVGYFWREHNLKLQADAGQLRFDAGYADASSRARAGLPSVGGRLARGVRLTDTQLRVQLQLAF